MQVLAIISIYESWVAFKSSEFISRFIILWHKYSHCPHVTDENTEASTKPRVARGKAGVHTEVLQAPEPCSPFIPHPSWGLGRMRDLGVRYERKGVTRKSVAQAVAEEQTRGGKGMLQKKSPSSILSAPHSYREVLPSFTALGTRLVATAPHASLINFIIAVRWVLLHSHPMSTAFQATWPEAGLGLNISVNCKLGVNLLN